MYLDAAFHNAADKPSVSSFMTFLRNAGYDHVGGGTFVECFTRPDEDDVILINLEQEVSSRYWQMCAENTDNPFFPRIHEINRQDKFVATRAEKLTVLEGAENDPADTCFLNENASRYIRYLRGESTQEEMAALEAGSPYLRSAVKAILRISQDVYYASNGATLPFCDLERKNIFLRKTPNGRELVFGDPLFPGTGRNADNMELMEKAYRRFDLPSLQKQEARLMPAPAMV